MNRDEGPRPEPVRPRRQFEAGRGSWLAIDAWRSQGELGLCYFVRLDEGTPTEDDRTDRRAPLQPTQHLDDLDEDALAALWSEGAPLTMTERRISAGAARPCGQWSTCGPAPPRGRQGHSSDASRGSSGI